MSLSKQAASQHTYRKRDKIRERELLQYYNPVDHPSNASRHDFGVDSGSDLAHSLSSPDLTLTALAQLCALRLNARRCIISVLDRDAQYSLAESTRSLDFKSTHRSETPDDGLWIGRARMEKVAGLCESVVNTPPSKPGEPTACIIVPDLSKDDRFKHMLFVKGSPYFKFYVGMPITTKNNVNIGSLCVLDEVSRNVISLEQQEFLAQISHAVMDNLERRREAEERKKVMRMSQGLAAFVDGRNTLPQDKDTSLPRGLTRARAVGQPSNTSDKASTGSYNSHAESGKQPTSEPCPYTALKGLPSPNRLNNGSSSLPHHLKPVNHSTDITNSRSAPSRDSTDIGIPPHESIDADYRATFARAANLLRESLNLQEGREGVVFFDTAVGYGNEEDGSTPILEWFEDACNGEGLAEIVPQILTSPDDMKRLAGVLAFSTKERPLNSGDRLNDEDAFSPVSEILLKALVKRYPRGTLWTFDEDGLLSSDDELSGEQQTPKAEPSRSKRKLNEDNLIQKHFPDVRQLLFTPLWDSGLSRWFSGCFCWAASNEHVFSSEVEGTFLLAFGNSIMAEVSRLATMAADKQKGDFIGSISHELRSPLHGILASAEFLSETEYDAFQGSLVNTIESCGRTLLDTINHVLDFSKINTFERNWRAVRKANGNRRRSSGSSKDHGSVTHSLDSRSQGPPLMNIYAITDVAAICEEVVEGVYAGQIYQYISSPDISDITPRARGKTSDRGLSGDSRDSPGRGGHGVEVKPVDIVLDIVQDDYTFNAQPGALRRVVMNIFGNAMKYTPSGTISVKLSLEPPNEDARNTAGPETERTLKFVVKDTGKGISTAYLSTRLFTPFSQESSLAPGTGLGLSIVKSIVDMLNGTIDVRSQVGQGTEITVHIPLMRFSGNDTPLSSSTASDRSQDDSVSALRRYWPNADVALYVCLSETRRVLEHYISDWFGLRLVASASEANVAIVDEADLPTLTRAELHGRAIVVLCTGTSGYGEASSRTDGVNAMEFMSKPFGPFKLAKALRICLERAKENTDESDRNLSKNSSIPNAGTVEPVLERWTLDTGDDITPIVVNGTMVAASSTNASMAIGLTPEKEATNNLSYFPFPNSADIITKYSHDTDPISPIEPVPGRHDPQRTGFKVSKPEASTGEEIGSDFPVHDKPAAEGTSEPALSAHPSKDLNNHSVPNTSNGNIDSSRPREMRPPWILIVDDNKINLRLLDTFMKKRKYTQVTPASNGRLAVQAVETHQQGFDIIFMDISMPVMDGFEATRAIREIEGTRRQEQTTRNVPENALQPALIIALTGLASSRDQSEAFTSGVDLFMSKPVSFKEVGRILDNWERRRDA